MIHGKYIILKNSSPILLPLSSAHSDNFSKKDCLSAGYFKYDGKKFECYGESKSLNLKCRDNEDSDLLNVFFKF